jgi:hypothetical protein
MHHCDYLALVFCVGVVVRGKNKLIVATAEVAAWYIMLAAFDDY